MQLDIVSDTICPWCYIGKRRLEQALAERPDINIDVAWRTFQLDPTIPKGGIDRKEYMRKKFGDNPNRARMAEALREAGEEVGIAFDFDAVTRTPNTLDSHRLLRWAGSAGVQHTMAEILFRRYFEEGQDIGDHAVLTEAAGEAGMDVDIVRDLLSKDADVDLIRKEDLMARRIGIQGVPAYVLNNKYLLVGAQDPAVLLQAFDTALAEEASSPAAE